jgi:hypothetical protein
VAGGDLAEARSDRSSGSGSSTTRMTRFVTRNGGNPGFRTLLLGPVTELLTPGVNRSQR